MNTLVPGRTLNWRIARRLGAAAMLAAGVILLPGSSQAQRINSSDYQPMIWGDWLVVGNAGVGFLYNSNLYGTTGGGARAGYGSALALGLDAARLDGAHATSVSAALAAGLYAGNRGANTYTGTLGITHAWSITRDMVWSFDVGLGFGQNTLDSGNPSSASNGVYDEPQPYLTGNVSTGLSKEMKDFIVTAGASANRQLFGDQKNTAGEVVASGSSDNGTNYDVNLRVSYKISPDFRLFVSPAYNWQRYEQRINNSEGYTLTGGVSFGGGELLVGGDIYAGWQSQTYPNAFANRTNGAPTFGGSLWWTPRRDISVTATLSQSYGIGSPIYLPTVPASVIAAGTGTTNEPTTTPVPTVPGQSGIPAIPQDLLLQNQPQSRTTTAALGLAYDATQRLQLGSTLAWSHTSSLGDSAANDTYTAAVTANYLLNNTWSVSGNYGFNYVDNGKEANGGSGSYSRNIVILGFRGRF